MAKSKPAATISAPLSGQQNVEIQVTQVDLLDFELVPLTDHSGEPVTFAFSIELERKLTPSNKLATILVHITAFEAETEPQVVFGKLTTSVVFRIENYEAAIAHSTQQTIMIPGLDTMMNSIAVSTARGTFSAFFRGTYLHHAVLPIIDPKQFMPIE